MPARNPIEPSAETRFTVHLQMVSKFGVQGSRSGHAVRRGRRISSAAVATPIAPTVAGSGTGTARMLAVLTGGVESGDEPAKTPGVRKTGGGVPPFGAAKLVTANRHVSPGAKIPSG